jgi:hypothetical protein
MVGHKLGEFALTRTFKGHTGERKAIVAPAAGPAPSAPGAPAPAPAAPAAPAAAAPAKK